MLIMPSSGFVVLGRQDLADPGPMKTDLASDGAVAEAVGAKAKNRLMKLELVGITMTGE